MWVTPVWSWEMLGDNTAQSELLQIPVTIQQAQLATLLLYNLYTQFILHQQLLHVDQCC